MKEDIATELFNVSAKQLLKKIESGTFVAADVNAAINLIKQSGKEVSFDNNKPAQDLNTALKDSDTGESLDPTKPPDYDRPELKIV